MIAPMCLLRIKATNGLGWPLSDPKTNVTIMIGATGDLFPAGGSPDHFPEYVIWKLSGDLRLAGIIMWPDFAKQLEAACPKGIDVYFENVGGAVQRAVWPLLNDFARIPVCGLIAHYNATTPMPGPDMFSVLRRRLLLRGFIVSDFVAKQADFLRDVGEWVRMGRLKYREDIVDGLEKAPASFLGMLQGKNFGKMLVRVAT